nr:hypothetical protein [Tanacetum cinerariifolium]
GCKQLRIDKKNYADRKRNQWNSKLEIGLCSRSHLGKGLYDSNQLKSWNGRSNDRSEAGYHWLRFAGTPGGALSSPGNVKICSRKDTHISLQTGRRHLLQDLKL